MRTQARGPRVRGLLDARGSYGAADSGTAMPGMVERCALFAEQRQAGTTTAQGANQSCNNPKVWMLRVAQRASTGTISRAMCTQPVKLWGGRFTGETDPIMEAFNRSMGYDQRMWSQDIQGSKAYALALGKVRPWPGPSSAN